jgi:hypothetical protein
MKKYLKNVLLGLDMFGNTLINGHPDETISARSGRAAEEGKLWGKVVSGVLNRAQKNHTTGAIQSDENRAETVEYLEAEAGATERDPFIPEVGKHLSQMTTDEYVRYFATGQKEFLRK